MPRVEAYLAELLAMVGGTCFALYLGFIVGLRWMRLVGILSVAILAVSLGVSFGGESGVVWPWAAVLVGTLTLVGVFLPEFAKKFSQQSAGRKYTAVTLLIVPIVAATVVGMVASR